MLAEIVNELSHFLQVDYPGTIWSTDSSIPLWLSPAGWVRRLCCCYSVFYPLAWVAFHIGVTPVPVICFILLVSHVQYRPESLLLHRIYLLPCCYTNVIFHSRFSLAVFTDCQERLSAERSSVASMCFIKFTAFWPRMLIVCTIVIVWLFIAEAM